MFFNLTFFIFTKTALSDLQYDEQVTELFLKNKYIEQDDISTTLFAIENKSNKTAVKVDLELIFKQYAKEESGHRFVTILSNELVEIVQEVVLNEF